MIVATAFALFAFLAVFVGGIIISWPEVPWTILMIASVLAAGLVPTLGYPTARTLWVALDFMVRPLEPAEIARASRNILSGS